MTEDVAHQRTAVRADVSVQPSALTVCRWVWGVRFAVGPARPDGRVAAEIRGHSVDSLAGEVAGLGALVEVHAPRRCPPRLAQLASSSRPLHAVTGAPVRFRTGRPPPSRRYRFLGTDVTLTDNFSIR